MTRLADKRARRMADIEPFHVMDLLAEARRLEAAGRDIVHMEVGEPDFPTPEPIAAAGARAILGSRMSYTPAVGIQPLREAIARYYQTRYHVDIPARRVIVTPGASGALLLATGVIVNPGDQILVADPGYPCNRAFVRLMEGEPRGIPVGPETRYQVNAELVARYWTDRTTAILVGSPSNPTGTLLGQREIAETAEVVRSRGGHLILDEIYHGLVYDGEVETGLALGDDIFVINSFSKYFGMTGWRLGWMIAPDDFVRDVDKLAQNVFLAPPTPAQYAALAAFEPDTIAILEQRREEFRRRRDFLLPALREIGFEIPLTPQGAFYLYANVNRLTDDSDAFVRRALHEAGVALTPGLDFGSNRPGDHVRFAYTTSIERLGEGVDRLRRLIQG